MFNIFISNLCISLIFGIQVGSWYTYHNRHGSIQSRTEVYQKFIYCWEFQPNLITSKKLKTGGRAQERSASKLYRCSSLYLLRLKENARSPIQNTPPRTRPQKMFQLSYQKYQKVITAELSNMDSPESDGKSLIIEISINFCAKNNLEDPKPISKIKK